jgi:hypothetical protein
MVSPSRGAQASRENVCHWHRDRRCSLHRAGAGACVSSDAPPSRSHGPPHCRADSKFHRPATAGAAGRASRDARSPFRRGRACDAREAVKRRPLKTEARPVAQTYRARVRGAQIECLCLSVLQPTTSRRWPSRRLIRALCRSARSPRCDASGSFRRDRPGRWSGSHWFESRWPASRPDRVRSDR